MDAFSAQVGRLQQMAMSSALGFAQLHRLSAPSAPLHWGGAALPAPAAYRASNSRSCSLASERHHGPTIYSSVAPWASISMNGGPLGMRIKSKVMALAGTEDQLITVPNLTGTWTKDKARSESLDEAIKLMRLNGVVRQAVRLVKGVKINMNDDHFTMAVFSILPWFKVTEKYAMSGEPSFWKRRDLRKGKHRGAVCKAGPVLRLELEWGDPFCGAGCDAFELVAPDELVISSTINVEGQTAMYRTVYTRKAGSGARARAGIVADDDEP